MFAYQEIINDLDMRMYRTLHPYNLIWAVCHLFPQQRWRTHTNNQSRETIGQENHMTCLKLRLRKFRPASFGADSKTRIFYKYVIFKHSFSFSQFPLRHSSYSLTEVKSKKMNKPRRHSFLQYTLTMRLFPVSEKLTVSNHKKK